MSSHLILGSVVVASAGLISGSAAWPIKLMKKYQFEHWWFIGMATGLVLVPWTVTLVFCPNVFKACATVPLKPLITANLWAAGWGVANILCGICFARIGLALTTAILAGLGLAIGAILPMVVKGSGVFQNASSLTSSAGLAMLAGVCVMLTATVLAGMAGVGRERVLTKLERGSGKFPIVLVMAIVAGILSSGMSLSFVYGQGAVVAAMKREGAGDIPATFAVWAVCLLGGAIPSVAYPIWLMTKKKTWGVLGESWREMALAAIIGINLAVSIALLGVGMLMLGPLGASVGFGIQQATWMLGGQTVGFISGEWRGVGGGPRKQIYFAIILLMIAILVMACGNALARP